MPNLPKGLTAFGVFDFRSRMLELCSFQGHCGCSMLGCAKEEEDRPSFE